MALEKKFLAYPHLIKNLASEYVYLIYVTVGVVAGVIWKDWMCLLFSVENLVFFLQLRMDLGILLSGPSHEAFKKFISNPNTQRLAAS